MFIELKKSEKKVAREIIEKGLQRELTNGLNKFNNILKKWENSSEDNKGTYNKLYSSVVSFDKHIGRRYDGITGSRYINVIVAQLEDGIINEEDLSGFSEETRNILLKMANY